MASHKKKRPRSEIEDLLNLLDQAFNAAKLKYKVCGSIRRGKEEIGDVDIVVSDFSILSSALSALATMGHFGRPGNGNFQKMTAKAPEEAKNLDYLIMGVQFNFRKATPEQWGAMVLYLTGDAKFNVGMRIIAKNQGYKLNQYGLWHGETCIAGKEERQIFDALGVEWYDPSKRDIKSYSLRRQK